MQTGYYTSVGGMVTQFSRLEAISNNLANVNTNGYKKDDVVIGNFSRIFEEKRDILPIESQTYDAASFVSRSLNKVPMVVEKYSNYDVGNIAKTDNPFDFALSTPNAYFAIETPDGIRYTRDGSFTLDSDGRLVTKQGFPVLSNAGFPAGGSYIDVPIDSKLEMDSDGNLYTRQLVNEGINQPLQLGRIAMVSFEDQKYLKKEGVNLASFPPERDLERTTILSRNALKQGYLEKSNINPVHEMTALIEAHRLVEYYSKALKTHADDMNTEATGKLANSKA